MRNVSIIPAATATPAFDSLSLPSSLHLFEIVHNPLQLRNVVVCQFVVTDLFVYGIVNYARQSLWDFLARIDSCCIRIFYQICRDFYNCAVGCRIRAELIFHFCFREE